MRLTGLHMSNFRGTREMKISFEPDLTVIVGRNGAGKTSILDALAMTIGLALSRFEELEPSLPPPPGMTIGPALFQSREPNRNSFGLEPTAQDVRVHATTSRLDVKYERLFHKLSGPAGRDMPD